MFFSLSPQSEVVILASLKLDCIFFSRETFPRVCLSLCIVGRSVIPKLVVSFRQLWRENEWARVLI